MKRIISALVLLLALCWAGGDMLVDDSTAARKAAAKMRVSAGQTERLRREGKERHAALTSPAARRARKRSWSRFEDLRPRAGRRVAKRALKAELADPVVDAAQPAPGVRLVEPLSEHTAVARQEDGRRMVVKSSAPLAVKAASNRLKPVNYALTETASAFEPAVAAVPVSIGKTARAGVEVGDSFSSHFAAGTNVSAVVDKERV